MMFELGRHQGTSHLDPFAGCNARFDIAALVRLFVSCVGGTYWYCLMLPSIVGISVTRIENGYN